MQTKQRKSKRDGTKQAQQAQRKQSMLSHTGGGKYVIRHIERLT